MSWDGFRAEHFAPLDRATRKVDTTFVPLTRFHGVSTEPAVEAEFIGEGTKVGFVHGIGATRAFWRPTCEALRAEVRSINLDLPGFGESAQPASRSTIEDYLNPVVQLLRDFEPEVLVGHSLGGIAALLIAPRLPKEPSVILVSASLASASNLVTNPWTSITRPRQAFALGAQVLAGSVPVGRIMSPLLRRSALTRRMMLWPFVADPRAPLGSENAAAIAESSSTETIAVLRLAKQLNFLSLLEDCTSVGQIVGAKDELVKQPDVRILEAMGVYTRVLENCGHWPMFESPEPFQEALMTSIRWLRGQG
jgi:pimeloyl-ACP methyl ester carboxylesterase